MSLEDSQREIRIRGYVGRNEAVLRDDIVWLLGQFNTARLELHAWENGEKRPSEVNVYWSKPVAREQISEWCCSGCSRWFVFENPESEESGPPFCPMCGKKNQRGKK